MSWPVARYGTWMHKSQDCPRICRGRETVGGLPEKVGGIVLCDPDCQRGLSKNHPDTFLVDTFSGPENRIRKNEHHLHPQARPEGGCHR